MIVKKFESFEPVDKSDNKYSDDVIASILNDISLIWEHLEYTSESTMFEKLFYKFQNKLDPEHRLVDEDDGIFNYPDTNQWWNTLSDTDRISIVDFYNFIYEKLELASLPNMDELDEIFIPLKDFREIGFYIRLKDKKFIFAMGIFDEKGRDFIDSEDKKIKKVFGGTIDIDRWDSFISEIRPTIQRIRDLGYKCNLVKDTQFPNKLTIEVSR